LSCLSSVIFYLLFTFAMFGKLVSAGTHFVESELEKNQHQNKDIEEDDDDEEDHHKHGKHGGGKHGGKHGEGKHGEGKHGEGKHGKHGGEGKHGKHGEDAQVDPHSRDADVQLSTCKGNKKALFIGINYFGSSCELHGCLNDVKNMSEHLFTKWGFSRSNAVFLTDDSTDSKKKPTRANILNGIKWLVDGAQPGDSLFFHYSGHGGTVKSSAKDESSGYDETICPMDYDSAGQIIDDDLHKMMIAPLQKGTRLTAIFDSCHSGTVLDLPYTYKTDGTLEGITCVDNRLAAGKAFAIAGLSLFRGDKAGALTGAIQGVGLLMQGGGKAGGDEIQKEREKKTCVADVIQWGGCKDEQTSADAKIEGQSCGAMSFAFIKSMNESHGEMTYATVLNGTRKVMVEGHYTQVPQLSTGYKMDINQKFTM